MAQPVVTVTLGGTDITSRVKAPAGSDVLAYGHGASFDGDGEAPGWCNVVVTNNDHAFNPRNSGSTYASILRIGKVLHVSAVYSATTYHLFDGFLRRIVPRDDGYAELICQDALFNFSRLTTDIAASMARDVGDFRAAILTDIGQTAGQRNLDSANGAESVIVYTGADGANVLDLLGVLNKATGSIHYIHPKSGGYEYTTRDRLTLQSSASVETWSDTDMANPFATAMGGFDYTDERVINQQRVEATPRLLEGGPVTVWSRDRMQNGASITRARWARFDEPTFSQVLAYTVDSGSATVTFTPFARSAKILVAAGAGGVVLKNLAITGIRALEAELDAGVSEDATSQATYGELAGSTIQTDYISSEAYADALGDWYVFRYKDPRATPEPTFINRFPTQLLREVGERVTLTSSELSLSGVEMIIRGFETHVKASGSSWETSYQLEEMPAALNLFTLGGTAAQGLGGSGVLGY